MENNQALTLSTIMKLDDRLLQDIIELQGENEISAAIELSAMIRHQDAESESNQFPTRVYPTITMERGRKQL